MSEFSRLLRDAAGQPPRPLVMDAIRHRAAGLGLRRRAALGIVVLGALIGIGAPVGVSLLPAGDRPAAVEMIGIDQDLHRPTPSTGLLRPRTSPQTSSTLAVSGVQTAEPVTPTAGAGRALTSAQDESTTGPNHYPAAAACSVDTIGLGEGQQRVCRFTATSGGGWNYYQPPHVASEPNAEVEVRVIGQDGESTIYRLRRNYEGSLAGGYTLEGCADGVIEPGDRVQVTITQGSAPSTGLRWELGAGAGEGWGCSDGGP